ncbi:MAG: hypothetical protein K6U08_09860, partial [Firmicutes bacterium]|nr:hypothetical protein [Bacillota bacterium]
MSAGRRHPFAVGVITDEVSQDPDEALRWAVERGLDYVDLRNVFGRNVTELEPAELDRLEAALGRYGLPVRTICPQLFRARLIPETMDVVRRLRADPSLVETEPAEYAEHLRMLSCALDLAERFGA